MSNKLTNEAQFEQYVDDYITVTENGLLKKYLVKRIDKNSIVNDAEIYRTPHEVLGLSEEQKCDICEMPCPFNIPVIQVLFGGKGSNYYGDVDQHLILNYINEEHHVYLNEHYIGAINTRILSANYNNVWFVPSNKDVVLDDINYVWGRGTSSSPPFSTSHPTTAFSVMTFNPDFYKKDDWNVLYITPFTANNVHDGTFPAFPSNYFWSGFYTYGGVAGFQNTGILNMKLLSLENGTNALSCSVWTQHSMDIANTYDYAFVSSQAEGDYPYDKDSMLPNTYSQIVSTWFVDLDPCRLPQNYPISMYKYSPTDYYTDKYVTSPYDRLNAYTHGGREQGFIEAPILRQLIVYADDSLTTSITLYLGRDEFLFNGNAALSIYYSDNRAIHPYNGEVYYRRYDDVIGWILYRMIIINGVDVSNRSV
jgi:hypothetical protein